MPLICKNYKETTMHAAKNSKLAIYLTCVLLIKSGMLD